MRILWCFRMCNNETCDFPKTHVLLSIEIEMQYHIKCLQNNIKMNSVSFYLIKWDKIQLRFFLLCHLTVLPESAENLIF